MARTLKKKKSRPSIKKIHSLHWVFDPFENRPDFLQKRMFGCLAAYLGHKMVLVLADSEEPWNGILIPTERDFHACIQSEFQELKPHPVLGKWLYLSQADPEFEEIQTKIVRYILSEDPRFGIDPKPKKMKMKRNH